MIKKSGSIRYLIAAGLIGAGVTLLYSKLAHSETFDIGSTGTWELELHSEIQFDQYFTQDCSNIDCGSEDDGFRIADFDSTLKRYTGAHSLILINLELGFRDGSTTIANALRPETPDTSGLDYDDNKIKESVLGYSYKQSEFTFWKHKLKTNSFGPSSNNFLSFSLSGFNDDRIDWFSYEIERSLYA